MKVTAIFLLTFLSFQVFSQSLVVEHRIKKVENNLMPFVPIKDFLGWNILERMEYYGVPGVSIAVIKDYKIDWAKAYGVSDTTLQTPVTTETMFSAGSISKFVMAVAALKLVEDGKIGLESPINNYLRSWKIKDNEFTKSQPISLRMLLSQSAGTSQTSYFGFTPTEPLPSIVEILEGEKISGTRPVVVNSVPDKEFRYSGGGSMIAQMALMDVSEQGFADLTDRLIFEKLVMENSTFAQPLPEKFEKQASWAYSKASWFKGMPYIYPQQAAAGLYSTPTDLAKFFIDVQNSYLGKGKILSQRMAVAMLTPQKEVSQGSYREQIGIGPFLIQRSDNNDNPEGIYFEFTGVNAGFLAYGIGSLTGGNGVIIMLNSGDDVNGLGKEIRRSVAKVYGWTNFLPDEIQPVSLSDNELQNFVGRYRMGPDEVLYLRQEKNYLVEKINEGNDIYCFPIAKDTIVFSDYNIKGWFQFDDKGNAISLQNFYQQKPMPKMKKDEFSPSEYLKFKNYAQAKEGYREMEMNEYRMTYLAYDLMNKKPLDLEAVRTILDLALEQHPNSSIVYSRWGDFFLLKDDIPNAVINYKKALELDPTDEQTLEVLKNLLK